MLPAPSQQIQGPSPMEEFDRALHGIDAVALALQEKIENERTLESQVRHKERLSANGLCPKSKAGLQVHKQHHTICRFQKRFNSIHRALLVWRFNMRYGTDDRPQSA